MKQVLAISLVALFGSVSLFGIISMLGHNNGHGGAMHCPLMGDIASMCPMGGVGHIAAWQSVFAAMTPQTAFVFLLIAFGAVAFVSVLMLREHAPPRTAFFARRDGSIAPAPNHLLLAFSRGILHPRLYA
jgi:hypothetical protein